MKIYVQVSDSEEKKIGDEERRCEELASALVPSRRVNRENKSQRQHRHQQLKNKRQPPNCQQQWHLVYRQAALTAQN